ncbi:class I SAM-dependent methyltransferase [Bacillus sp. B1-b2]|uniref:class I SAM-dependent methyltransferase n=1 Tax=Bacillus sp. B1-b2 TaxID=2653201 RepID=UPI0012617552|nr:class I SAM-dependent methyltransferase [Bacillus sp. B1-b2]KAB7671287.1 class I SAM-dependent methyltransferase [Bacillus sp. B1-b2]
MENQLFNQEYWEKAWKTDPNTSLKRMKKAGLDSFESEGFATWARNFDASSFNAEGVMRTERIIKWIENQIHSFKGLTVLDVGAASGVFSIPFSKRGAIVSSLEPSTILSSLLKENAKNSSIHLDIINQPFEEFNPSINVGYDFVFASMCPAMTDWDAVKKALSLSNKYFYVSLMAGSKENQLIEELMSVLDIKGENTSSEMFYLLQLLYLNNYKYQSLIERHQKTINMNVDEVVNNLETWFIDYNITLNDAQKSEAVNYLNSTYKEKIPVTTGGKFGKVLVYL